RSRPTQTLGRPPSSPCRSPVVGLSQLEAWGPPPSPAEDGTPGILCGPGVRNGYQRSGPACATGPAWPARRVTSAHLTLVLPVTLGPGMPLADLRPRLPPPSVVCLARAETCGRPPASTASVLCRRSGG